VLSRGDWILAEDRALYQGEFLPLTRCEAAFLHILAVDDGSPVSALVLGLEIGQKEEPERPATNAKVLAYRLRRKLPVVPFETVHGLGYRWAA
jgi:DNA-binding response OmpR family regulator